MNTNLFNYNFYVWVASVPGWLSGGFTGIGDFMGMGGFRGMGGFTGKYVNSVCTNFARKLDGGLVLAAQHHMHERKGKKNNCTNLANNLVEEAAREGLLDPLLEPPVWGPVGYVSLVGGTTAALSKTTMRPDLSRMMSLNLPGQRRGRFALREPGWRSRWTCP